MQVLLSTRTQPDKSVGTDANWELAESDLQEADTHFACFCAA